MLARTFGNRVELNLYLRREEKLYSPQVQLTSNWAVCQIKLQLALSLNPTGKYKAATTPPHASPLLAPTFATHKARLPHVYLCFRLERMFLINTTMYYTDVLTLLT